jgi:hypothetical protein
MNLQEILVPCKYDPDYKICNLGYVVSYKISKKGHVLSYFMSKGYKTVTLYISGEKNPVHFPLHRLVAEHFIPNDDPEKIEVNHKNLCKTDNIVSNLEWTTPSENINHAYKNGARPKAGNERKVLKCDLVTGVVLQKYPSAKSASQDSGINYSTLKKICAGKNNHIKDGFIWRYKHPKETVPCPESAVQISGFSDFITREGKIWSSFSQTIRKTHIDDNGYERVRLRNGTIERYIPVHKLVAETFLGPCPPEYQVNHKDSNPSNNNLSNLEFLSASENTRYAITHGNRPLKPVLMIDPVSHNIIKRFASTKEATEFFIGIGNISTTCDNIQSAINGSQNTYLGYQFIFEGDPIRDLRKLVKKIEQLTPEGTSVAVYDTYNQALKAVTGSESRLRNACNNGTLYKNYCWRKIELLDIPIQSKERKIEIPPSVLNS